MGAHLSKCRKIPKEEDSARRKLMTDQQYEDLGQWARTQKSRPKGRDCRAVIRHYETIWEIFNPDQNIPLPCKHANSKHLAV
jgi:hypothetical protein